MVQRGEHVGFAAEARYAFRIVREAFGKDLQRDVAPELRVVGAIHVAHAARAEGTGNLVVTELRACGEWHARVSQLATGDATILLPQLSCHRMAGTHDTAPFSNAAQ